MTQEKTDETKHLSDVLELEKVYLSRTISLKDGTYGFLFTKSGGSASSEPSYQCHPCNISLSGRAKFLEHVNDSKHVAIVEKGIFPRANFTRILEYGGGKDIATYVTPGEPLPPGMEGIVELPPCEIQKALDEHVEPALIGLEYLVEIVNDIDMDDPTKPNVKVTYMCMLCEKKGTSFNIITHVGSPNHHLNYFRRYFPNVFMPIDKFPKVLENKEGVNSIIKRIAAKVEKKYGRMKPKSVSNFQIMNADGKLAVINDINAGLHFKEEPEDVQNWMKFINFKYVLRPEQLPLDYPPSPPAPRPKKKEATPPPSLYMNRKPAKLLRRTSPEIVIDKELGPKANTRRPRRESLSSVSSSGSTYDLNLRGTSPISLESNPRSPRKRDSHRSRRRSGSPDGQGRAGRKATPPRHRRHNSPPRGSRPAPHRRLPYPPRRPARSRSRSRERSRRPRPNSRERPSHRPPHRSRSRSPYKGGRELPYPHRERREEEYRRNRTSPERSHVDIRRQREKYKLEQFKEELARIEIDLLDKLKYHEKNPEKHPLYPEEWKLFWNRRYKELQAEGKDPNSHDFKPEWIDFWDKRMKELHDSDLLDKKKALKDKLDITSESLRSKSPVSSVKNTWQYPSGSASSDRRSRSRSPLSVRSSLRRSLSPPRREKEHLARKDREHSPRRERDLSPRRERELSPRRERILELEEYPEYPPHMMMRPHGHPFPPRYPGHMIFPGPPGPRYMPRMPLPPPPGYLPPGMVLPPSGKVYTEAPLNIITVLRTLTVLETQLGSLGPKAVSLLSEALSMEKNKPTSSVMLMHDENCVLFETIKEKLRGQLMTGVVERHLVNATRHAIKSVEALLFHAPKIQKPPPEEPEHSGIDKEAIAKQIAAALVTQGRPDVSNEELEVLIDAVIQMAKAQAETTGKEVNTKNILSQLQESSSEDTKPRPTAELSKPREEEHLKPRAHSPKASAQPSSSGLDILQSSYDDDNGKDETMEQLSEQDVKDLLRNFKTLSRKEQLGLITYLSELEAKDPVRVKVYRKYLEIDDPENKKLASSQRRLPTESTSISSDIHPLPSALKTDLKSSTPQFFVNATSGAEPISDDESDDENYSIEDVYKVAAAKVEEKEKKENPAPVLEANSESKSSSVDVTSMSAFQASNILDWIRNNATESTDLFKLIGESSKPKPAVQSSSENVNPISENTSNVKIQSDSLPSDSVQYSKQEDFIKRNTSSAPSMKNSPSYSDKPPHKNTTAGEDSNPSHVDEPSYYDASYKDTPETSYKDTPAYQDNPSYEDRPPFDDDVSYKDTTAYDNNTPYNNNPAYSATHVIPNFQSAPPPPPPSSDPPLPPQGITPQFNPAFPQQPLAMNYNSGMMLDPNVMMNVNPMNPAMMGVQFPMGAVEHQNAPPRGGYNQPNDYSGNSFSGNNDQNNHQDDDYSNDYDDYSDNQGYNSQSNYYNKGNEYNKKETNNYRGGNRNRGRSDNSREGNYRGNKPRGGRGNNQSRGRGGRGRGNNKSGW